MKEWRRASSPRPARTSLRWRRITKRSVLANAEVVRVSLEFRDWLFAAEKDYEEVGAETADGEGEEDFEEEY